MKNLKQWYGPPFLKLVNLSEITDRKLYLSYSSIRLSTLRQEVYSWVGCARFAEKNFSLISEWSEIGSVSHVFRLFTIKCHFYFFAYFCFKLFASLHFSNFRFEAKQSEAKFKYIFSLFIVFFTFFRLKFFASLRFSNFRFEIFRFT